MSIELDGRASLETDGRYRSLLEAAPDAMVVVNHAGEIVLLNLQAEKQFGYLRDELVGQPVTDIIPEGFAERLIADDLRSSADALAQQIGTGIELVARRKDRSEFPIEMMLSPLESADGILVTAAIRDISVRKATEEHLREAEGRYRGLLEAAPDAMVVVNNDGAIVLLNVRAEKQFGYHRDELLGQPVTNIIPVGFAERLISDDLRSDADALAQQIGSGIELSARRKDGSEFPIEIMLSPLDSADGVLVTAAIRDISVRKSVEGELLQAQKLESIGRLAGGIAHDFNNMLSIIRGYADFLDEDLSATKRATFDPDEGLRSVHAISGAASRAANLTAQLLAFSRRQVVKRQVLSINASVNAIEPMLAQLIGRTVHLALKLDPAAGNIRADPGQIDQIMVNLIVNARDAMPDGGTVTIETANVAGEASPAGMQSDETYRPYVLLTVTDTGAGMDESTRKHLFEPFFTTKLVGKGTGLGLATTHGIVHQTGGHISIESEPGHGSAFALYFPRIDSAAETLSPTTLSPRVDGAGRILLVEDEPDLLHLLTQILERVGYEVTAVADGTQALAVAARSEEFDALVSDVVMPNLSGIELAKRMVAQYPRVGVVLLSGYTSENLDLERLAAAGMAFLPKPISSPLFLQAVRDAVASRRADPTIVEMVPVAQLPGA